MFCPYCGTQLPDGSAFCGHCGKPLTAQASPQPTPQPPVGGGPAPVPPSGGVSGAPKPPKKPFRVTRGMTIGIVAAAVVVVVVVVAALAFGVFGLGGRSAEDTAKQAVEAGYSGDAQKVVDLMLPEYVDYYCEEYYGGDKAEMIEDMQDNLDDSLDNTDDSYGKGWTCTVEVKDVDEYDEDDDEYDNVRDYLRNYDVSSKDIQGVASVEVEYSIEGPDDSYDSETTLTLVKEGNTWYVAS